MELKKYAWDKALVATSKFEGSGYDTITGNFDGQYLSIGILQWNIGRSTLQPLLHDLFDKYPDITTKLPNQGVTLKAALDNRTLDKWAMTIQKKNKVIDPWLTALKTLCITPEFKSIQDHHMSWYRTNAILACKANDLYTDRAFSLFFDIAVQNGGIPKQYFIDTATYHDKLVKITEVAVAKSNPKWQQVVRDRKMCIVNGTGTIYGDKVTFYYYDANAFIDESLREPIAILESKKIIKSPDYWLDNTDTGIPCRGEYVGTMMMRATNTTRLDMAVFLLEQKRLLTDANYWKDNAVQGKYIDGNDAKILIKRLALL